MELGISTPPSTSIPLLRESTTMFLMPLPNALLLAARITPLLRMTTPPNVLLPERTSVPAPDLTRFPPPPIGLGTVNRSLRLKATVAPPATETLPALGLPLVPPLPKATEPELICTAPDPLMLLVTTAPSERLKTSTPL